MVGGGLYIRWVAYTTYRQPPDYPDTRHPLSISNTDYPDTDYPDTVHPLSISDTDYPDIDYPDIVHLGYGVRIKRGPAERRPLFYSTPCRN